MINRNQRMETIAAQAMGAKDEASGAIVPAIHLSSTFERDPDNAYSRGFLYARPDNVTVRQTEAVITALEKGSCSLLFGSGMAAATTAFLAAAGCRGGRAHVVAPTVLYWGLKKWLVEDGPALGVTASFVDTRDPAAVASAIRPGETGLIWLETPGNPTWEVTDIRAVADVAKSAGVPVAVDSTCATPVLTQPLTLGADIVMHAATKYLNGHSDVVAGSLTFAAAGAIFERAAAVRKGLGSILGPFEAALLMRGMRTLPLRVRQQSASALEIARHFSRHPNVQHVLYPGLERDPGHAVASRQMMGGFGGMLSIRIVGGEAMAIRTAARVGVWIRATSLGGVESLVEHRASIEGPATTCPPDLLRLSVGLENVDDLIGDLEQALAA